MVKFTEEGQGYWDFILENCSGQLIEAIERDLKDGAVIMNVENKEGFFTTVYLTKNGVFGQFIIHTEIPSSNSPIIGRNCIHAAEIRMLVHLTGNEYVK